MRQFLALTLIISTLSSQALAIYSTVQNNKLAQFVEQMIPPVAEQAGISANAIPALIQGLMTGTATDVPETVHIAYQTAFSRAVRIVYLISIAFGVLSIGGALISPNPDSKFNTEVARRVHGKENTMVGEKGVGEEREMV